MIIRVERSGGFAGMTVQSKIDTENLDPEERQNLIEQVQSSGFFETNVHSQKDQQGRDRFHYTITIEYHEKRRTVDLDESEIPDDWQALIGMINQLARRYRT
jgi:hypothetical protein